jgi:hypothetical protein
MVEQDFSASLESVVDAEAIAREILTQHHQSSDQLSLNGFQFFQLANLRGMIAAINTSESSFIVANMPLLALPYHGKFLTHVELMEVLLNIPKVEDAQFSVNEQAVNYILCRHTKMLNESEVTHSIQRVFTTILRVRSQMMAALDYVYPAPEKPSTTSLPFEILPAIPLLPKQMKDLYQILTSCSQKAQSIFCFMMENWIKMKGVLTISQKGIHFYCKTAGKQVRLASLLPPVNGDIASIHLVWDHLLLKNLGDEHLLQKYQKQVESISSLRVTGSRAVLRVRETFTMEKAGELIQALSQLAQNLQTKQQGDAPRLVSRKENVQSFMDHLEIREREIIQPLITAWKKEEGKIRVSRLKSLSLILDTSHTSVGETLVEPASMKLITINRTPEDATNLVISMMRGKEASPFFYIPSAVQKYQSAIKQVLDVAPIHCTKIALPIKQLNSMQVKIIQTAICDLLHAERLAGINQAVQ